MHAVHDAVEHAFMKNNCKKHVEVEFRLGKFHDNHFNPDVGKVNFDRMLGALTKFKGWESTTKSSYEIFYGPKNLRTTIDEENDKRESVIKTRIDNINCITKDLPFDIRMSVSTEKPYEETGDEEYSDSVCKKRFSFVRKGLSIDMTEVHGDNEDMDSEQESTYQVEFEIIQPHKVTDKNTLYNHINKIKNLLGCLRT